MSILAVQRLYDRNFDLAAAARVDNSTQRTARAQISVTSDPDAWITSAGTVLLGCTTKDRAEERSLEEYTRSLQCSCFRRIDESTSPRQAFPYEIWMIPRFSTPQRQSTLFINGICPCMSTPQCDSKQQHLQQKHGFCSAGDTDPC